MANLMKTGKTEADRALESAARNVQGTQVKLDDLLKVSRLAREARQRRGLDEDRAPLPGRAPLNHR